MFLPIGGGPTIPPDAFLELMPHVQRLDEAAFDTGELGDERPLVVVPAAP